MFLAYLFFVLSVVSKGVLSTGPSVSGKWPLQQTVSVCPQAARFDAEIGVACSPIVQYTRSNCWFSVSLWKNVVHSILSYWHFALAVFGFLFSIGFVAYSPIVQYTHSSCWFSPTLFHHTGIFLLFLVSFFPHMFLCWRCIFPDSTIHTFHCWFGVSLRKSVVPLCSIILAFFSCCFWFPFFSPYVSLLALHIPR